MRGGFLKGVIVGTVIGSMSSMLLDPNYRQKAMGFVDQGGQMLQSAQSRFKTAESWINKGRNLFQNNEQSSDQILGDGGSHGIQINSPEDDGIENITQRVAILEKRLEELGQKEI